MLYCGLVGLVLSQKSKSHWLLLSSVSLFPEASSAHGEDAINRLLTDTVWTLCICIIKPLASLFLQSCLRPNSPAVGGTPVTIPRLRQTTAKKLLRHAHSSAAEASGQAPVLA